jgi:hypothetical protein
MLSPDIVPPHGSSCHRRGRPVRWQVGTRRGCRCKMRLAPIAYAPMIAPSSTRQGSPSSSTRSLKVPGSDSSALTTKYLGCPGALAAPSHFAHVGKAAPPRPSRSDALSAWHQSPVPAVMCGQHFAQRLHPARLLRIPTRVRPPPTPTKRRDDAQVAADIVLAPDSRCRWYVRARRTDPSTGSPGADVGVGLIAHRAGCPKMTLTETPAVTVAQAGRTLHGQQRRQPKSRPRRRPPCWHAAASTASPPRSAQAGSVQTRTHGAARPVR